MATQKKNSVMSTFVVRAIWTIVMIAGFVGIVLSGHVPIVGLVSILSVLAFREVIKITKDEKSTMSAPWSRNISWYLLICTLFYLEGDSLFKFFHNVGIPYRLIDRFARYHAIFSYALYIIGFMYFVISLKPGYYRQQYAQLCTTCLALIVVVVQGHYIGENVLHGLFWFLVPASLVIVNDICAYLCGITMGRHPLIAISPKKTWEGFLGAWVCTMIFGVIITSVSSTSNYIICPMERFDVTAFSEYACTPNPVFVAKVWHLPQELTPYIQQIWDSYDGTLTFPPIYLHVLALSTFASLIAPFGGFFASGVKRAFNIKDFGDTIPGHGGITDRFDCQFIMGYFAYIYYVTFIAEPGHADAEYLLRLASQLTLADKQLVVSELEKTLRPAI